MSLTYKCCNTCWRGRRQLDSPWEKKHWQQPFLISSSAVLMPALMDAILRSSYYPANASGYALLKALPTLIFQSASYTEISPTQCYYSNRRTTWDNPQTPSFGGQRCVCCWAPENISHIRPLQGLKV